MFSEDFLDHSISEKHNWLNQQGFPTLQYDLLEPHNEKELLESISFVKNTRGGPIDGVARIKLCPKKRLCLKIFKHSLFFGHNFIRGIPLKVVNKIFVDADILGKPAVTTRGEAACDPGIKALYEACPEPPQLLLGPDEPLLFKDGQVVLSTASPDDWLCADDTVETVTKKVRLVNIESIQKFQENIVRFTYLEKSETTQKSVNTAAYAWLDERLKDKCFYVSSSKQFYFYNKKGFWSVLNSQMLLDTLLSQEQQPSPWSFTILENALKVVAPKYLCLAEEILSIFENSPYIGFQNGTWDLHKTLFVEHSPKHFLMGVLPFEYKPISKAQNIYTLCPRICQWLISSCNGIEVYVNILLAFLLIAILDIKNPERFLFITGPSGTGKSTYLKLLQHCVSKEKSYIGTSSGLTTDFCLQELFGKSIAIFHDLGNVFEKFVSIVRNLVSSGETMTVQRKYERGATLNFTGVVAAASNQNPFNQQQREGIINRRMIYIEMMQRIPTPELQPFEALFPQQELANLASFALTLDRDKLLRFIRRANEDSFVKARMLESFQDNITYKSVENFCKYRLKYLKNQWSPLGNSTTNDPKIFVFNSYVQYCFDMGLKKSEILSFTNWKNEIASILSKNIREAGGQQSIITRRFYNGRKIEGLKDFVLVEHNLPEPEEVVEFSVVDIFRSAPFWIHVEDEEEDRPKGRPREAWAGLLVKSLLVKILLEKILPRG